MLSPKTADKIQESTAAVLCVVTFISFAFFITDLAARAAPPPPPVCDPSKPLHERVSDAHARWFEGELMGDCDATVMIEAMHALERCGECSCGQ